MTKSLVQPIILFVWILIMFHVRAEWNVRPISCDKNRVSISWQEMMHMIYLWTWIIIVFMNPIRTCTQHQQYNCDAWDLYKWSRWYFKSLLSWFLFCCHLTSTYSFGNCSMTYNPFVSLVLKLWWNLEFDA